MWAQSEPFGPQAPSRMQAVAERLHQVQFLRSGILKGGPRGAVPKAPWGNTGEQEVFGSLQ